MDIKKDLLPENFKEVVDLIGLEKATILIKHYGGDNMYIPKMDCFVKYTRNNNIIDDYKLGYTYKQLVMKYKLTNTSIRHIINTHSR